EPIVMDQHAITIEKGGGTPWEPVWLQAFAHGASDCRARRRERRFDRREHLRGRDVLHAAMVPERADRLVTGTTGQRRKCLDRARERVERRPVPGAGRA